MSIPNRGFWVLQDGSVQVRDISSDRKPQDGEARIKVLYSGINPADTKHVAYGIYDTVIGYDFCGVVEEAGTGFPFATGDIIAGSTPSGVGRLEQWGTHQNYIVYPANSYAIKVPPNLPPAHAACLKVVVRSAADGLFVHLGLRLPTEVEAEPPQGGLLVWGGTTSLGVCAIQLAKAIGVHPILATASPRNHQILLELGATACFDYTDRDVATDIKRYAGGLGTRITMAFDTVGSIELGTADQAAACADVTAKVVTARANPKYKSVYAAKETDAEIDVAGAGRVFVPAAPNEATRGQEALLWVVENYGTRFKLPHVKVLSGDKASEAIQTFQSVAKGKAGFGKFVLEHPIC